MSSNALITISSIEEGDIDRDRIVDDDLVPDELFCPICRYLLWKPRSCASCQHLFCEKCIQRWIEDPISVKSCPFRCQLFEDRRCPPSIQSLLSRLNIHCRNSEFGCSQILGYNQLEYHENVQCQYLSKRCSECDKLILVSKFDEHQQILGLCIPYPIKCTICQNSFEKYLFREHFHQCCQARINQLNQIAHFQRLLTGQPMTSSNNVLTFIQNTVNTIQLIEEQRQSSRLPTSLKGIDAVRRAREQNCGHFYHILIMLKFILLNWSKIPFFLYTFTFGGFIAFGFAIIGIYTIFSHWAYKHIYYGPFLIILSSYLLCYGTSIMCQFISDSTIIISLSFFMFLCSCIGRMSLEMLEMDYLFNRPILSIVLCCISILLMKIILLLFRLYYWSMPIYVGATLFTFVNFYMGFKVHCAYAIAVAPTNQLTMPVYQDLFIILCF